MVHVHVKVTHMMLESCWWLSGSSQKSLDAGVCFSLAQGLNQSNFLENNNKKNNWYAKPLKENPEKM